MALVTKVWTGDVWPLMTRDMFCLFTGYGEAVDWRCLASHDQGYVLWTGDVWSLMTRDMFCGLEMSGLSWPGICSVDWRCLTSHDQGYVVCCDHNLVLSSYMTCHRICNKGDMKGATNGAATEIIKSIVWYGKSKNIWGTQSNEILKCLWKFYYISIRLFRIMWIPTTFRLFLVLTSEQIGRRLPVITLLQWQRKHIIVVDVVDYK